jgi:hypothetical protein
VIPEREDELARALLLSAIGALRGAKACAAIKPARSKKVRENIGCEIGRVVGYLYQMWGVHKEF